MRRRRLLPVRPVPALILIGALLSLTSASTAQETALDRYIAKADSTYSWRVVNKVSGPKGLTTFVVDMKSQTWRTTKDVNRPVWQHWLVIARPKRVDYDKAFLFIGGGRNGGTPPDQASSRVQKIALATNSVVAELKMIPNQSLVFHNDGVERVEDNLIGYAWDQYLKTGDETWLPRLPMVKSAVRAMDTIESLMAGQQGGNHTIRKFVVAGGSKRGWTTWLTGAADKRVVAIVPIVIDVLNVDVSMRHHYAAYGFWAPAVGDYVHHKIMDRMGTPELANLYKNVDPYYYRHRLTMPKFIVNASGDQFFLPDSSQFYFDDLVGEKHLRYVPNANHSLRGSDSMDSITAFYSMILRGTPRPKFSWTLEKDGSIRVQTKQKPVQVKLWQATNPEARDFRVRSIGKKYTDTLLADQGNGVYVGKVAEPKKGWTAFFIELTYDSGTQFPLKMTTQVRVLPDTLPYANKKINASQK